MMEDVSSTLRGQPVQSASAWSLPLLTPQPIQDFGFSAVALIQQAHDEPAISGIPGGYRQLQGTQ